MTTQTGEALKGYNTLALQARAQAFVCVHSDTELLAALTYARALKLPVVPLGEGSNMVLVGDINALVLHQKTRGIEVLERGADSVTLCVAAGERWHDLVRWTLENGYYGLENLALIPGMVGAAPIQNIGAYGVELRASLLQVQARNISDSQVIMLSNEDCQFGYRDSIFKRQLRDQLVITAVTFRLSLRPDVNVTYPALASYFDAYAHIEITPKAVFEAVISIRSAKLPDPAVIPNAGSFFKNPVLESLAATKLLESHPAMPNFAQQDGKVKLSAAWLIDQCGWKGVRRDSVGVHQQHALVLVNYGKGSGERLLALAEDIAASVETTFGLRLEIEPRVYGTRV